MNKSKVYLVLLSTHHEMFSLSRSDPIYKQGPRADGELVAITRKVGAMTIDVKRERDDNGGEGPSDKRGKALDGSRMVREIVLEDNQLTRNSLSDQDVAMGVEMLTRWGVAVLPFIDPADCPELTEIILNQLIFFNDVNAVTSVGGFGALGTADSVHAEAIRNLRRNEYEAVLPVLEGVAELESAKFPDGKAYMSCLYDRFMIRKAGKKPTSEAPHRDTSPTGPPGALIYGGWVSLRETQSLICFPGSQGNSEGSGFTASNMSSSQLKAWRMAAKQATRNYLTEYADRIPAFQDALDSGARGVPCPEGHILIFEQNLEHEVAGNKGKVDSVRLFTGAMISATDDPLFPDTIDVLTEFAVPLIKSGQATPMWPNMVYSNSSLVMQSVDLALNLDERVRGSYIISPKKVWYAIKPELLARGIIQSDSDEDCNRVLPWPAESQDATRLGPVHINRNTGAVTRKLGDMRRIGPSLLEAGFATGDGTVFPSYTAEELNIYSPGLYSITAMTTST